MKIMKIGVVIAAMLAAGSAYAQGAQISAEELARAQDRYNRTNVGEQPSPMPVPLVGGKTRAQVREELRIAQAAGLVSHGELDYPPQIRQAGTSSLTRAQVREELRIAQAAGLVSHGELDYPPQIQQTSDTALTRAQVREDLRLARAAGLVSHGELDYPPQL